MKGKHAQKNFGAMAPTPLSLKTRGRGEGGGGLGGVAYKDRARPPPRVYRSPCENSGTSTENDGDNTSYCSDRGVVYTAGRVTGTGPDATTHKLSIENRGAAPG